MADDHSSRYSTSGLTSSSSSIGSYNYNEEATFPVTPSPGSVSSINSNNEIQVRNRRLMSNENIEILRECLAKAQRASQYKGYMYQESNELSADFSEFSPSRSQSVSGTNTTSTSSHGGSPTTPHVLRSSHQLSRTKSLPISPRPATTLTSSTTFETSVINAEKQKEIINTTMKISTDFFKTLSYILNTSEQSNSDNGQVILYKEQLDLLKASLNDSTKELETLQRMSDEIGPELGEPRDWNEEYQQCLRLPQDNAELRAKRFKAIATVAQNFEHAAQTYGRIIISEVFVPAKYRTIKPFTNLGGNAGGEKYIYNGILFKFATDWKGIYGGDHEAMKAASHEMLSLMTVQNCDMEAICTPLMTLIDYLGFRLIAMSLLPVSDNTLIYGSSDGGRYVHADDIEVNKVMDQLSKRLNLAPHVAGMTVEDSKTIGFPVDIEGHRGEDGRFYLLDLARLMPPTLPVPSLRSCFLYRLFRPEFIRQYHKALSSDAFSPRFDVNDPNRLEHQHAVKSATDYLLNSSIPKIATMIQRQMTETMTNAFEVTHFLRAQGVNTRYLAVVRKNMQSSFFKQLLLIEMVARGIKNYIRELLRETKRSKKVLSQEPYREVLIDVFNRLLGNFNYASHTIDLWNEIHKRLSVYFPGFPTHSELVAEAPTPVIQAGFAIINHVCPAIFVGDKQVPIAMHECYTCGLMGGQGICSVCAQECHAKKGHSVSRSAQLNRGAAYCDCKQQELSCPCVSTALPGSLDETKLGEIVQCPLRYMIMATGIHRVFTRIQEMTGIRFSETALEDLQDHRREFVFVSPDIVSLQPRIKKLPIVSVAEAQAFRITAKMLIQPQERYRLYKQSQELLQASLLINPGSEALLNAFADVCIEMAHNVEDTRYASALIEKTLRVYRALKNKDAVKILVVDMIASKRPFTSSVFQSCFEIILSQSLGNVTAKDIQFIAEYGDGIESLNFDGSTILDDNLLLKLAPKCQNVTSLRLGYCYKVTGEGIMQLLNICGTVLRELILDGNQNIGDDLIRGLPKKCPNLVHLSLVAVPFQPELARQVPWMKKLTCLNLNFTSIDTPLYSTTLRVLRLHKSLVSLAAVKYMVRWSPLLKHIDISWCEKITNGAPLLLSVLKYAKQMKIVSLDGIKLQFDETVVKNIKAVTGTRPTLCINSMAEDELDTLRDCGFTQLQIGREKSSTKTSS